MAVSSDSNIKPYSKLVGFIFIFNLIVGTGCLAMPKSFQDSGYVLSSIMLLFIAFMSYLPVTLMIEAMSIMNALQFLDKLNSLSEEDVAMVVSEQTLEVDLSGEEVPAYSDSENQVLYEPNNIFLIKTKFEMSDMVKALCGPVLNIAFAINICLYLYGDLSVYSAAVAKSIRNVACTMHKNSTNFSAVVLSYGSNLPHSNDDPCWTGVSLSRMNVYRLFVVTFALCMLPLFYKRASIFQAITTVTRWIAICLMLVMAIVQISKNKSDPGAQFTPVAFKPIGLLSFFGVCVYSFMCHHSLPRLVTPIVNNHKHLLLHVFMPAYVTILLLYLLLSTTAVWAFKDVQDFYPLNFISNNFDPSTLSLAVVIIDYFLALFPVFTLSSNFPIIGITLVSNLYSICNHSCFSRLNPKLSHFIFILIAILPSITLSLLTDDLQFLVGFTGAFAGSGIQYVFPAIIVYNARKLFNSSQYQESFTIYKNIQNHSMSSGEGTSDNSNLLESLYEPNANASPFKSKLWLIFLLAWASVCVVLILVKKIMDLSIGLQS